VYLFYILPDQTVIKRILIGPMAFRERELCVVVLHSANTRTNKCRPPNAIGPMKVMLNNCVVQQNVIQVHINLILQMPRDLSK
jgi:hypothetical protein